MKLLDAHHHLWIPERRTPDIGYGWLRDIGASKPFGDPTPIQRDYEWPEYAGESSAHEPIGSVFVQTDGALPDPVAETDWVQSVFDTTGLSHAIVALADLAAADLHETLTRHARHAAFRGVRHIVSRLDAVPGLSFAPRHLLRDDAWRDGYARLGALGLSFDLQCYPEQMHEAADLVVAHPNVPVVLDHAGSPHDASADGFRRWCDGIDALATLDHVSVKLSGFGMFDRDWSARSIGPLVSHLVNRFGADRLLFGSNFPVDKLMKPMDDAIAAIDEALGNVGLGLAERERVFADNARRIYRMT